MLMNVKGALIQKQPPSHTIRSSSPLLFPCQYREAVTQGKWYSYIFFEYSRNNLWLKYVLSQIWFLLSLKRASIISKEWLKCKKYHWKSIYSQLAGTGTMPDWLNHVFSSSWLPHSYINSHIPDEVDYIKKKKKKSSNLASVLVGGSGTTTKSINFKSPSFSL